MFGAVDIGGTKTLVAVFDKHGKIIEQQKFPTPQDYEEFKIDLAKIVAHLSTNNFQAFGVAAPGKIDHDSGNVIAAGNLGWHNVPLKSDLELKFGVPVYVHNDCKIASLAEAVAAGKAYSKVLYITVSTGIGIGVSVDGKIDKTLDQAEPGWMNLEHDGHMIVWEKFASGKAIFEKYGERASELKDEQAWQDISVNLAKGMITLFAIIQPDLVVIGGGVGAHFEKFQVPLLRELKKYENPLVPIPEIKSSDHPEEVVIYGCYEYARQHRAKVTH